MSSALFQHVELAPRDPILGVTEAFAADPNPRKVNLGVGIYYNEEGKVPLLQCVARAERQLVEATQPRAYLPIDGLAVYDKAVQHLVFGVDAAVIRDKRVVTVQALGGTGGLKIGADFLRRIAPQAEVWISDPSWENHRALFEYAGFKVNQYRYYSPATNGLDAAGFLAALRAIPSGHVVVLHACCHNPTGADLSHEQWAEVMSIVAERNLVPFLDLAYQGFGDGIEDDAYAVRAFAATGRPVFVSSSFSKSFSLYGERVGALSIVATDAEEATRILSQVKRIVRTNYSNPPSHGGKVVSTVLDTPELRALWEQELGGMRERIRSMRQELVTRLGQRVPGSDYSFVLRQRGMFSYSGLTKAQVERLAREFSVYAIDTGRICVAALNGRNIDYVAEAIATVTA
jgi:aromatic-amino-acid transaminase